MAEDRGPGFTARGGRVRCHVRIPPAQGLNAQLSIMISGFATRGFLIIGGAVITVGGKEIEKETERDVDKVH